MKSFFGKSGFSLMEVNLAVFIMATGVLAMVSLYPLAYRENSQSVEDVKAAADIVSTKPGGKGCLREVIEKTLRAQGKWVFDTGEYKRKF